MAEETFEEPQIAQNRDTDRNNEKEASAQEDESLDLSNSQGKDFLSSISFEDLMQQDFF